MYVDHFSRNSFRFNASAAIRASHTKCPVATIVTSVPSLSIIALPMTKGSSAGVKLATTGVQNANKQGHDDQQVLK
jgi:hypothetical protein